MAGVRKGDLVGVDRILFRSRQSPPQFSARVPRQVDLQQGTSLFFAAGRNRCSPESFAMNLVGRDGVPKLSRGKPISATFGDRSACRYRVTSRTGCRGNITPKLWLFCGIFETPSNVMGRGIVCMIVKHRLRVTKLRGFRSCSEPCHSQC